jgi:N utilization substance protein B
MINRTMVRTRVVQTLFAYYQDAGKTPLTARKELLKSYSDVYSLYMLLLDFANELTLYAERQYEESANRARATHQEWSMSRNFVDNRLSKQLFENQALRSYMQENSLSWESGMSAVETVYKELRQAPFYKEYMQKEAVDYDDDKRLWKKIYKHILPENAALLSALEEMEVVLDANHWTTETELVISYALKTIKQLREHSGSDTKLLPMFESEEELSFGKDLLDYAITHHADYSEQVAAHLRNWEVERVAYMDRIILEVALAEILNFPDIALEVSLNEYLEIAKEYSSEKSHLFINGILNEILKNMKEDNKLIKNIRQ